MSFLAFGSGMTPDDTDSGLDVFVRDRSDGTTVLASDAASLPNGASPLFANAISGDGQFVSFCAARQLDGLLIIEVDLWRRDLSTGDVVRISQGESQSMTCPRAMNGDGRQMATQFGLYPQYQGDPSPILQAYVHARAI